MMRASSPPPDADLPDLLMKANALGNVRFPTYFGTIANELRCRIIVAVALWRDRASPLHERKAAMQ
jgi:hypothetical protein